MAIYYDPNTNLFTDDDDIEYGVSSIMSSNDIIKFKKNGGTYCTRIEGESYMIDFPKPRDENRTIIYFEKDNTLRDELNEIIFNIFSIITPNELYLFKYNKESVVLDGIQGGLVHLIYTADDHKDGILELINHRQRQVIVHSVLYYQYDTNFVDDKQFNKWAYELVKLQHDYPELTKQSVFYLEMRSFDGTTGFYLADHVWGNAKALQLMRWREHKDE